MPGDEKEKKEPKPAEKKEKDSPKPGKKAGAKHRPSSTHIDHHGDGSHTVKHLSPIKKESEASGGDDDSYAVQDDAGLMAKMQERLGASAQPGAQGGEGSPPPPEPMAALHRLGGGGGGEPGV